MNPCQVTQGFTLRSIRERLKSLSLLACNLVQEQCIIGHTKKRIILGVCLGSSVLNPVHWPLLYRSEGQGELVQFSSCAETYGADHTINSLRLSQEWRGQFDSIDIRAVHATCAPSPSKP